MAELDVRQLKELVLEFDKIYDKITPINTHKAMKLLPQIKADIGSNRNLMVSLAYYNKIFKDVPRGEELMRAANVSVEALGELTNLMDAALKALTSRAYEKEYEINYGKPPEDARYTITKKEKVPDDLSLDEAVNLSENANSSDMEEIIDCLLNE